MLSWLPSIFARHPVAPRREVVIKRIPAPNVEGRYDAAQTTDENRRHWANADGLSANLSNTPLVRRTIRNRARYEVANNSYARGIVLTLANDVIGTGPRLQIRTDDRTRDAKVEATWQAWADEVRLAEQLRTMIMAKKQDGETFGMIAKNERLLGPVKMAPRVIEADQVTTPTPTAPAGVDGIELDGGFVTAYHVLKNHPGDSAGTTEYDVVPAKAMMHLFRADRPGMYRGISEIAPALPLFAMLRRFTLAVIAAAETAADFAAVLYTDAGPDGADDVTPLDTVELERRMATTLPSGWKLGQVDAKQPTTTYREFKAEILNEIARCLNMPYNIAACNSSSYNYASGRLDHQTYFRSIQVEQGQVVTVVLNALWRAWWQEARLAVPEFNSLPESLEPVWIWDGREHVDPAKEATAQATRLANHTTTLAAEYARAGKDWEAELRQRGKELALMKDLGLTAPPPAAPANAPADEEGS